MSLDLDALEAALAEPTDVVGVTLLGGEAYATRTLVALVAAAPDLIAAARERDALRAIVERLSADLDTMHAGRTEARALVAGLELQVGDLRALCREAADAIDLVPAMVRRTMGAPSPGDEERFALVRRLREAGGEP